MQYSIEYDILRLTVDSHGAEPVSVIHKPTGAELLWQAARCPLLSMIRKEMAQE